jgi:hypothetical protein
MTTKYVLQVPHQFPPKVWYGTESEILSDVWRYMEAKHRDEDYPETFEEALEYLGSDAHAVALFENEEELRDALASHIGIPEHQLSQSVKALRDSLPPSSEEDEE